MRWSDQAILLSIRKFSESAAVVKLFSRNEGIYSGAVRGAFSKSGRGLYQPGNVVQAVWNARVEEQLGNIHAELEQPVAAFFMADQGKLLAMSSALAFTELALAERDPHPTLYDHLYYLLQRLKFDLPWQEEYLQLELTILTESGFGLELDSCVATGTTENLSYVSPKSGHAVSVEAGLPYKDKLLKLPDFIKNPGLPAQASEINDGFKLTGFFLENRLLAAHHQKMPIARERLAALLSRQYSAAAQALEEPVL